MRPEQAKVVFGDVSKYHLRRVEKLSASGLLVRNDGYIRPSAKGLKLAGFPGAPLRLRKYQYEHSAILVDLLSEFPGWSFEFAIDLKRRGAVHRRYRLGAVISREGARYGVYVLTHEPRPATARFLRAEMSDLRQAGIDRTLVLCTGEGIARAFGDAPPDGLRECCVLPYPSGVALFKRVFSPEFRLFLERRFPGLEPCPRPFADFSWRGSYVTVLTHNDLVRRSRLSEYLSHVRKREGRTCFVVCAPSQVELFSFPGAEVVVDDACEPPA